MGSEFIDLCGFLMGLFKLEFGLKAEKVLSFVPPDGNFRLISYHIGAQNIVAIPIYLKHHISFRDGRLDITVGPKQTMGRQVENVSLEIPMPKSVLNCSLTPSQGKYSFDPVSKVLMWDVGKIDVANRLPPNIKGTVSKIYLIFCMELFLLHSFPDQPPGWKPSGRCKPNRKRECAHNCNENLSSVNNFFCRLIS